MIDMKANKLLDQELCLIWDGVRREWFRVLYFNEKGQAVEVQLTPANPRLHSNWEPVQRLIVRSHRTFNLYGKGVGRRGDRIWRYVVRNRHSIVFNELRTVMMKHLPFETINRLLYWDFLAQIDWDAYLANKSGDGCAFALCKKKSSRC
jgi:hypothetical protein